MPSKTSSKKEQAKEYLKEIALNGTRAQKLELFRFDASNTDEEILIKFKLFARSKFYRYFQQKSAPFHDEMILRTIKSYRGANAIDIAFRGSAKTTLKKLCRVYLILNDRDHFRRYIKILCRDLKNSTQIVTDMYNMCVEVRDLYGDVFDDDENKKREERMGSFTMATGVKVTAGTVGTKQRGHLQDAYRPDWILFDDIEDRESVSSQAMTKGIIERCDEAITGLSINGSWEMIGNYISEYGSVQWFLEKKNTLKAITPIMEGTVEKKKVRGVPTWNIFTVEKIQEMYDDSLDFFGDYMCDPSRSEGKFFDTDRIEEDIRNAKEPDRVSAGIKFWIDYKAHHRYGVGADTSEGIGRDSNALAMFDFKTGELGASYYNNEISPDLFAHEIARVGAEFGNCVVAPEINNMSGGIVIAELRAQYQNIFRQIDELKLSYELSGRYGWHTNGRSKATMFMDFRRDYNDGLIKIYDIDVLKEMKSYTNSDLTEQNGVTRHFDLLTACCIAWQMKNFATPAQDIPTPASSKRRDGVRNVAR